MSILKKVEEQILIRPEDYESFVKYCGATECYAVRPISADAISDVAEDIRLTPHFYDDGMCQIVDNEYSDEVATMTYHAANIDGEDQWVIEYFESKDTWIAIEEDRYGTVVWKIARKLKVKIVSKFWIDYHFQQFPNCGLDRTNVGNPGVGTDETRRLLEVIWDTYYGDFEYEREFNTIEKIYKEVKVERAS